jgi:SAM-dependent methyltransferase
MDDAGARDGPACWSDPATVAAWLSPTEPWQSPIVTMEEPMFWRLAGDVGGVRVLDVGCGDGSLAGGLLPRGATRYHGIDPSPPLLARAAPSGGANCAGHDRGA